MKLHVLQSELSKGLGKAIRGIAKSSTTLPVLEYIMLSTDNGRLKLSATNLEIGIVCWVGAKIETDGAITVPARTLVDLVNTFPSDERIEMKLKTRTQTLHLKCGRSTAKLKGIDALEFPEIPAPILYTVGADDNPALIDADVLKQLIKKVAFAAAKDEGRLMLTGVLTTIDKDRFSLATADGFRVSTAEHNLEESFGQRQALIPAKALIELGRILNGQDAPIEISFTPSGNQVIFHLENTDLVAQLINLQFPDYEQIIPKSSTTEVMVSVADLRDACRAASIFAREAADKVDLHFVQSDKAHVEVVARSDETGDNVGKVDIVIKGDSIKMSLNVGYLLDLLAVIDTDDVIISMTTERSPLVFKPIDDNSFIHVIMPMQTGR